MSLGRLLLCRAALFLCASLLSIARAGDIPRPSNWVNDAAGVLSDGEESALNGMIAALERETSAEVAVLTVPDLGGDSIEFYAQKVFDRWKIGKADKNNGLLIVMSLNPRGLRVHTGYGLEGVIPDGLAGALMDDHAIPAFKKGAYGRGLIDLTAALIEKISAGNPGPESSPPPISRRRSPVGAAPFLIGLPLFGLLVLFLNKVSRFKTVFGVLFLLFLAGTVLSFWRPGLYGSEGGFHRLDWTPFLYNTLFLLAGFFIHRKKCPSCGVCLPFNAGIFANGSAVREDGDGTFTEGVEETFYRCPCGVVTLRSRKRVDEWDCWNCPRCAAAWEKTDVTVLVSATTSHGGENLWTRKCACGLLISKTVLTPRIVESSSRSSGGFRSSSGGGSFGGFGGGSSGGGGASRSW